MHEAQQPVPSGAVAEASSTIIRETALGVVLIVVLVLFVWAVRSLKQVQDERVVDKEAAADRLEKANAEGRKNIDQLTSKIGELATAQNETAKALDRYARSTDDLVRAVDGVIRDAIVRDGSYVVRRRASSGGMPAVREPGRPEPVRQDPRREP